jgi:hypothetical protein
MRFLLKNEVARGISSNHDRRLENRRLMKLLKKILIGLAAFVALLLLVSIFLNSKVHVERKLTINAPAEKIFAQINTVKNWEQWSPWHKLDPIMKLRYEGPASGAGAKYYWESQQRNVGNGSLTIMQSVPNQDVQTAMDFGQQGQATGKFQLEKDAGGTQVVWSMDTDMGRNPIGKFFGLLMDRMIGRDFERGLNNLKTVCEAK